MRLDLNAGSASAPMFKTALKTPKSKEEKQAEDAAAIEKAKVGEEDKERLKKLQEQQRKMQIQQEKDMLKEQLESSKEEADNMAKGFEDIGKCLTIAIRIQRGDIVPQKDMKFLMEREPDLYKQAILMRQPKRDPKKWDSLLEDEEEDNTAIPEEDTSYEQELAADLSDGEAPIPMES